MNGPDPFQPSTKPARVQSNNETRHRIRNGIYVPEQIPQAALRACEDPRIIEIETALRRVHRTIPPDQGGEYADKPETSERRAGRIRINKTIRPREETSVKAWGLKTGLLLEQELFEKPWEAAGRLGESEHDVYPENGVWTKRNNLSHHGTWLEYFHRLLLHNWLFPDTKLTLTGITEQEGCIFPVVTQADIISTRGATSTEIDGFMQKMEFVPIQTTNTSRQFDYISQTAGIEVNDLHDENVLIRDNGDIAVMDPVPMMEETSKIKRILRALKETGQK